jgi:ribonuclease J
MGMDKEKVFIVGAGDVLELTSKDAKLSGTVPSGLQFVDGLGVGDVGNIVLRDRRHLSQDGLIVVVVTYEAATGEMLSGPDIISRGFVYVRESEQLIEDARNIVKRTFYRCDEEKNYDWLYIKNTIKSELKDFMWQKTKRSPMILPVIVEV